MENQPEETQSEPEARQGEEAEAPVLPHARNAEKDEAPPPLYISGFGPLNQSTPDVATGSTPVTRKDD